MFKLFLNYIFILNFRPGFSRLNFSYIMEPELVDYAIHAVDRIATNGWKLLPLVIFPYFSNYHDTHNPILSAVRCTALVLNKS